MITIMRFYSAESDYKGAMVSYVQLLLAAGSVASFTLRSSEARGQCGNLIKSINFEGYAHVANFL